MFLGKLISKSYAIARPINYWSNNIGLVSLVAMMLLTAVDVTLRKTINFSILGAYEVVKFLMAVAIGLAMAQCGLEKGHIVVDVFISRLSKFARGIAGCVTGLLSLGVGIMVTWQTALYVPQMQASHQTSPTLIIPLYPFIGIVAFGLALYAFVLLIHFWEFLSEARRK